MTRTIFFVADHEVASIQGTRASFVRGENGQPMRFTDIQEARTYRNMLNCGLDEDAPHYFVVRVDIHANVNGIMTSTETRTN